MEQFVLFYFSDICTGSFKFKKKQKIRILSNQDKLNMIDCYIHRHKSATEATEQHFEHFIVTSFLASF